MKGLKHTPGPWIVDTDYIIQDGGTSDENTIAIVGDQEEWKSNAHLIAAAPEMLKALEHNCRTNCQRRMLYTGDKLPLSKTRDCVGCPMGKAINRAKGLLKQRRKRLMSAVKKGATHDN